VVKHQANEVACMQGAANVGVPHRCDAQTGAARRFTSTEPLAASLSERLASRDLTAVVPGAPPPPGPGAGGVDRCRTATATRAVGTDAAMPAYPQAPIREDA
jgi:hypothetical protein